MKNIALFTLLLMFVYSCQTPSSNQINTPNKNQHNHHVYKISNEQKTIAEIEIGKLQKTKIENFLECTGFIDVPPPSKASVTAPLGGILHEVKYYPGHFVQKGDVLCEIRDEQYINLQSMYLESKQQLKFIQNDYLRKKELVSAKAVSEKDFQKAEADYLNTKTILESLEAKLKWAGFNPIDVEKNGVHAGLTLHAPISGYITEINGNLGKHIEPTQAIYELIDVNHLHIELQVFIKDLPHVKPNAKIYFNIPENNKNYNGHVYLTGKKVLNDTKTVNIHGHIENTDEFLLPGTVVHAKIVTQSDSILALPTDAIFKEAGKYYVFVETHEGIIKTEAQIGLENEQFVQIKAVTGYNLSDNFVVKGAYYLIDAGETGHSH